MTYESAIAIDARADIRAECARLEEAWNVFVRTRQTGNRVRRVIEQSWARCAESRIDAFNNHTTLALSESEVFDYRQNSPLFSAVEPVLASLIGSAFDSEHMLVLGDACGNIVSIEGDHALQKRAEAMNFVVGSSWNEHNAGTNAIGTAIAAGVPVQVFASEHYCERVHPWTCSASPILDPTTNRVMGVVDLTGLREVFHPHTLAVVITATKLIEQQLRNQFESERFYLLERYIRETARTPHVPIAVLDRSMRIVRASAEFHEHGWIDSGGRLANCPVETLSARTQSSWEATELTADAVWIFECSVCLRHGRPAGLIVRVAQDGSSRASSRIADRVTGRAELMKSFSNPERLHTFDTLIGTSESFRKALAVAECAGSELPVLIEGETGTGKELIAQAIHRASTRRAGPFVVVNCAARTDKSFARELFQSEFQAPLTTTEGVTIPQPSGGTIFLDHIRDMDAELQTVLLKVLEKQDPAHSGEACAVPCGARVIAATDTELLSAVRQGSLRRDLYYRLNVIRVDVPPLRNRIDDLEMLVDHFCRRACSGTRAAPPRFDVSAMRVLKRYGWPGNVRELRNVAERLVATGSSVIYEEDLPSELFVNPRRVQSGGGDSDDDALIRSALKQSGGNVARAARLLQRSRSTIYRYLNHRA